jgi:hypothetical protein
VGDSRFRSSEGGVHFHKSLTQVLVGGLNVTDGSNVTLASEEPPVAIVRRLQVGVVYPLLLCI